MEGEELAVAREPLPFIGMQYGYHMDNEFPFKTDTEHRR